MYAFQVRWAKDKITSPEYYRLRALLMAERAADWHTELCIANHHNAEAQKNFEVYHRRFNWYVKRAREINVE